MTTDNKDLPAYPQFSYEISDNGAPGHFTTSSGISQRSLIAAMCLQGLLASWGRHGLMHYEDLAHDAVLAADALLTHLKNTEQ